MILGVWVCLLFWVFNFSFGACFWIRFLCIRCFCVLSLVFGLIFLVWFRCDVLLWAVHEFVGVRVCVAGLGVW